MEKIIQDSELGEVIFRVSRRNKRYAIRIISGQVIATMPVNGNEQYLMEFVNRKRDWIIKALKNSPPPFFFHPSAEFTAATFTMKVVCAERANVLTRLKDGILTVTFPNGTCFEEKRIQALLHTILKNVYRHEAKRLLPGRVMALAGKYGFACNGVKINSSRTHWGSCTSRKTINLSLYLMKLPLHLVDYVLLHELCHTMEMNHSEHFWKLMDKVTGGQALNLRKELKAYRIN